MNDKPTSPLYPSRRSDVRAQNVVATSQPLAAQAGLDVLRAGGNAVDAALATAITLTVVEPTMNGIGSDAFAIVAVGESAGESAGEEAGLHGFNGSGRSPAAFSPERFAGRSAMPGVGPDAVTVPGAVDAWVRLSERFGALPFPRLFESAIAYAREGFPVSPIVAATWPLAASLFEGRDELAAFGETFLPGGRAPAAGEIFRCPAMAETLEAIAESRGESFYRGALAAKIAGEIQRLGGVMTEADLGGHEGEWVDCLQGVYAGAEIHEIPPNGQGIAALIALGILEHLGISGHAADSADCVHLQVEAMKLAFAEAHRHVGDPAAMQVPAGDLLDPGLHKRLAAGVRLDAAAFPEASVRPDRGTVYLCAADASGMMVSFIQSNFFGFGSGVVVPGTGISLQNRGRGFVLEAGHANEVGGAKRPFHTIVPAMATRGGAPLMAFGVMGGHHQPQGHVQVVTHIFDHGCSPQAALDAPRWHVDEGFGVHLEEGLAPIADELAARGQRVQVTASPRLFGGGQVILREGDAYVAGSDPRKDGQA
nr:gamma-glutamyltransferase family protein [Myxococcota bacterium]